MENPRAGAAGDVLKSFGPGDLTLGQLVELFRVSGDARGRQWSAALREGAPDTFRGSTAQDTCTLVMLGLVRVDRGQPSATPLGRSWLDRVCGTVTGNGTIDRAPIASDAELWGAQ